MESYVCPDGRVTKQRDYVIDRLSAMPGVSVVKPTTVQVHAVADEIIKVSDSVCKGLVNETMIARQLAEEFNVYVDWDRRDRG